MKSSRPLADPCVIWLLAYPHPSLVRQTTATPGALRKLFDDGIVQHSGYRTKEGFFRVDLSRGLEKFTLYADSTLHTDPNEFCQVFYFDIQRWKEDYAKEYRTTNLAKDLTEFQDVLPGFAQNFWGSSWLRYTIGNANGARDAKTAEKALGNLCS